jgi:hypothetical protein
MAGRIIFYGELAAAGTGTEPVLWPASCGHGRYCTCPFLRRVGCGQGQIENHFYNLTCYLRTWQVTSSFSGELAAGRNR